MTVQDRLQDRRAHVLLVLLLVSLFFPLFPKVFGNAPIHLVVVNVILSFILIFRCVHNSDFVKFLNIFAIVFLYQVFILTMSWFNGAVEGVEGFTDVVGIVKPIYMLLFLSIGASLNIDKRTFELYVFKYLKIAIVVGCIFSIYEIFLVQEGSFIYDLYKREERLILLWKSVTWFGVSYYHSFFYLIPMIIFLFKLSSGDNSALMYFILSLALVLSAQSRTIFAVAIIAVLFILMLRPIRLFKIFAIFGALSIIIFSYYSEEIIDFFWYLESGLKAIEDYESSGSITVRMDQILSAIKSQNWLYGVGLGRHGAPLESIYSSYVYRFGFINAVIFIVGFVVVGLMIFLKGRSSIDKGIGLFWAISPIAMFASPMIEFPKITFPLFLISGYVFRSIFFDKR